MRGVVFGDKEAAADKPKPRAEHARFDAETLFPGRLTLRVKEIAEALSMSENQITNLIESGDLLAVSISDATPGKNKGRIHWRIPASEFDRWISTRSSVAA